MVAGRDDRWVECACGLSAERKPFSGTPYLNGETVVSAIPDPVYRHEATRQAHRQSWGGPDRAVEMLRKNSFIDETGEKAIDMKGMAS